MTESEWLTSNDPQVMLNFLRDSGKLSERKARLFAVAVCRRIWPLFVHDGCRRAVEFAESFADGLEAVEAQRQVRDETEELWACLTDAYWSNPLDPDNEYDAVVLRAGVHLCAISDAAAAATSAVSSLSGEASLLTAWRYASQATAWAVVPLDSEYENRKVEDAELAGQAALLRDLLGPLPFRPLKVPPSVRTWHGATVVRLAQAAYDQRELPSGHLDRHHLAVLADALEETGADAELVEHLRGPGPHVRGCFVIDLLTGRE